MGLWFLRYRGICVTPCQDAGLCMCTEEVCQNTDSARMGLGTGMLFLHVKHASACGNSQIFGQAIFFRMSKMRDTQKKTRC